LEKDKDIFPDFNTPTIYHTSNMMTSTELMEYKEDSSLSQIFINSESEKKSCSKSEEVKSVTKFDNIFNSTGKNNQ
jgi:hypothetical protein